MMDLVRARLAVREATHPNPPEWLEEVDLGTPEAFKVWRVRRDQAGRKSIAAPLMQ